MCSALLDAWKWFGDDLDQFNKKEISLETDGKKRVLFVIQAVLRKLIASVMMKSRKQMTKGLLLIRMYEGNKTHSTRQF